MERLTKRNADGSVSQPTDLRWGDALRRLADYEDTGLTPEEIKEDIVEMFHAYRHICHGIDHDSIYELARARAEMENRLKVLPCKVGDKVWTNFAMSGWYFRDKAKPYPAKVVFIGLNDSDEMAGGLINVVYGKHDYMMQFSFSEIGKTVFLTREEAEAALKGGVE